MGKRDTTPSTRTSCSRGSRNCSSSTDVVLRRRQPRVPVSLSSRCLRRYATQLVCFSHLHLEFRSRARRRDLYLGQMAEECTAPDLSVSIYQYSRDDLPPNALENPTPTTSPVL
ncbi:hypothetical protein F4824DRAFT_443388 [Ustulina deusta]|nr:hypothetical protein F4824DRAFT_443388 [Ustulina deusta]